MSIGSALRSPTTMDGETALGQSSSQRAGGVLPFHLINRIAFVSDLVLIVIVSLLSGIGYHLTVSSFSTVGPVETFFGVGAVTAGYFSAILAARGAYQPQNLANFWKQARETTQVWLFAFFVLSVVAFSLKVSETYSRGATLTFFAGGWLAITVWRLVVSRYLAEALAEGGFAQLKTILIAEEGQLDEASIIDQLKRCGYLSVRTFEFSPGALSSRGSSELFRSIEEIIELSRKETIQCVFLLVSWDNRTAVEQFMNYLRVVSVPVYLLPDRNVAHFLGNRITNIGTAWTAELKRAPLTTSEQAWKRGLDILIATLGLIMLAPLMVLVAVLIKIESRGPVLFLQMRNGFNGRPFRICKFRTMFVLEDGPVVRQATKNDPRVTHLGRLLRRTNIDELPQLLNVITGDMSLVGPRPHASAHNSEYEKIIANYAYRYHVKPGLTGWAQVNGLRGETQTVDLMARRVEFDLWYINNWNLWLDFKILLRTLLVGLQPTAY